MIISGFNRVKLRNIPWKVKYAGKRFLHLSFNLRLQLLQDDRDYPYSCNRNTGLD